MIFDMIFSGLPAARSVDVTMLDLVISNSFRR